MAGFDLEAALEGAIPGLLLEFGVYKGESINRFARILPDRVFYGFDSFRGLPEAWLGGGVGAGHFDLGGVAVPCRGNVELVVGLFQDTLGPFLAHHSEPVSFCHIDSDIYSSAAYVLGCLRDRFVSGSLLAFDEIFGVGCEEEMRAWTEYLVSSGQSWEFRGRHSQQGLTFKLV